MVGAQVRYEVGEVFTNQGHYCPLGQLKAVLPIAGGKARRWTGVSSGHIQRVVPYPGRRIEIHRLSH